MSSKTSQLAGDAISCLALFAVAAVAAIYYNIEDGLVKKGWLNSPPTQSPASPARRLT